MSPFTPDLPTKRDNCILRHVYRQRATMLGAMLALFPNLFPSYSSLREVIRRLVAAGFLNRYPLFRRYTYYRLGPEAVRRWRIRPGLTTPLKLQALTETFGVLAYCMLAGEVPQKRLLSSEILARYPWFPAEMASRPFAHHWDGQQSRLTAVRVELSGRPERIIEKHLNEQQRYLSIGDDFRQLLAGDGFMFVTVTATSEMAEAIARAIEDEPDYPTAHIVPCPLLLNLATHSTRAITLIRATDEP